MQLRTLEEAKLVAKYRKMTALERVNKAQSQLRMAWNLIKSQHMEAHYIDAALAQISVAAINLEDYRRSILRAIPKAESGLLALGRQLIQEPEKSRTLALVHTPEQAINVELADL